MMKPAEPISLSIYDRESKSTKRYTRNSEMHLASCRNLCQHIEDEMNDTGMQEDRSDESTSGVIRYPGLKSGVRSSNT